MYLRNRPAALRSRFLVASSLMMLGILAASSGWRGKSFS